MIRCLGVRGDRLRSAHGGPIGGPVNRWGGYIMIAIKKRGKIQSKSRHKAPFIGVLNMNIRRVYRKYGELDVRATGSRWRKKNKKSPLGKYKSINLARKRGAQKGRPMSKNHQLIA